MKTTLAKALLLSVVGALTTSPAHACKALGDPYPKHLYVKAISTTEYYAVVEITSVRADGLEGIIRQSFGGTAPVGSTAKFDIDPTEPSGAVCRVHYSASETRLLHVTVQNEISIISQYDWYNVPSTHYRFRNYVADARILWQRATKMGSP
jgi:hypothetical protein